MYSNGTFETELEDLEALAAMEYDESDESDESDLSERRRQPRRVSTAPGRNLYSPRPTEQYVTQTQLQTALAKVGAQIKTNSNAIRTIDSRIASVRTEQSKQTAMLKKEISDRKKETESLKRGLQQTRELGVLLPLLSQPSSQTLSQPAGSLPAGTKVLVDKGDTLSTLLPILLLGGLGDSGGTGNNSGGLLGGGDGNSLLPILLLTTLSKR